MLYSHFSKIASLAIILALSFFTIQSCTSTEINEDLVPEEQQEKSLLETFSANALSNDRGWVDSFTEQSGLEKSGNSCRCRAWLSDISPSLGSFPENSYYAALVAFKDQNGEIFEGEILNSALKSKTFTIHHSLLPVSIVLEGHYDGAPTFPEGFFKVNIRCSGGSTPSLSSFSLVMDIEEGQEELIRIVNGRLDQNCRAMPVSND